MVKSSLSKAKKSEGKKFLSHSKGKLFLLLGPSGSGKGTILDALRGRYPSYVFPISCTTRSKRPVERNGVIYHFISPREFKKKIKAGEFLEWAVVHHNFYYGTLKKPILQALKEGKVVIREVDVQGLYSIRRLIPKENLVSIFLTVSSWPVLKKRILRRSKIGKEELRNRYESFKKEMKWAKECDYVIESREGEIPAVIAEVERVIKKKAGS